MHSELKTVVFTKLLKMSRLKKYQQCLGTVVVFMDETPALPAFTLCNL